MFNLICAVGTINIFIYYLFIYVSVWITYGHVSVCIMWGVCFSLDDVRGMFPSVRILDKIQYESFMVQFQMIYGYISVLMMYRYISVWMIYRYISVWMNYAYISVWMIYRYISVWIIYRYISVWIIYGYISVWMPGWPSLLRPTSSTSGPARSRQYRRQGASAGTL